MTKTFKTICSLLVCALLVVTLASCSKQKMYEGYAEDIKVAAAKEEHYTYEKVSKKLGTPTVDVSGSIGSLGRTGVVTWYAGCESMDEVNTKLEEGKSVPWISVTFSNGKATSASTGVSEPSEE